MKKFTLMLVAGLFALAGSVQAQEKENFFKASNVALAEDGTGVLEVFIDYETTETVVGWNLSLYLPDEVKIATKTVFDEDLEEDVEVFDVTAKGDDYSNSNAMANALDIKTKTDGGYLFVCIDQKNQREMKNTNGKILSIPLVASSKDFSGKGSIKNIGMTSAGSVSLELGKIADVEFFIGAGSSEGINDIHAADTTAPAYNLQGIRVNNAAKGLIIRDGKKMVVK